MGLTMSQRKAVTLIKARAYARGTRSEKIRILDELVDLTVLLPDGELDLSEEEAGLLMRMSARTIDRWLGPGRSELVPRGRSHTRPGSLSVPSRSCFPRNATGRR
jgi:hypothetical protein